MTQQEKIQWTEASPDVAAGILESLTVDTNEAQSPLRDFEGDLFNYKVSTANITNADGTVRSSVKVEFQFKNVVVNKSVVPYPHKTASLTFNQSKSASSAWGIFLAGAREIFGAGTQLSKLLNRRMWIVFTPEHLTRRQNTQTGEWEDIKIEAFDIMEIDGQKRPTPAGLTTPVTKTTVTTTAVANPTAVATTVTQPVTQSTDVKD